MKEKVPKKAFSVNVFALNLLLICIFNSIIGFHSDLHGSITSIRQRVPEADDTIQYKSDLRLINSRLKKLYNTGEIGLAKDLIDTIKILLKQNIGIESGEMADACYFAGTIYLTSGNYNEALSFLTKSAEIFEKAGLKSLPNYSNCLYNTGLTYINFGDYLQSLQYMKSSSENDVSIYGENSVRLVEGYLALSINSIYVRDFDEAIRWINKSIRIAQIYPDSIKPSIRAFLYSTKGVAYSSLSNFDQAKINLEKAENLYRGLKENDLNYINVLDNLGTAYHFLGSKERSYFYYEKGLTLLKNDFSYLAFNLINNYAIILANDNHLKKGEQLLLDFLKRVEQSSGYDKRNYYLILRNYADYLRENKIDEKLANKIYLQCYVYADSHRWDKDFRDRTILGLSLSLLQNGDYQSALDSIQTLLFPEIAGVRTIDPLENPDPALVKSDGRTIKILNAKYEILIRMYCQTGEIQILEAAAKTSELIIGILERIRFNIGEEGSRLLLGDKYREFYIDAIECFNECYIKSKNRNYLGKVFEYSEKSKVASLLASTRESKAKLTQIPLTLASTEKELQRTIGFYNSRIAEEENLERPDQKKISLWKDYIMDASWQRDSLLKVFEKDYPGYYSIKYNTRVTTLPEVPGLIGKRSNYLSYIISDTLLYILVSNRKYQEIITQKIDSSFFNLVAEFRKILITPDLDENSNTEFIKFQIHGHNLYSSLIEPVKKYLISNNLIISPDNILSYIPFETLITNDKTEDNLIFRSLSYLMNEYRISYAYSATLLSESAKSKQSFSNSLIAFAPEYLPTFNTDSVSNERFLMGGFLNPLPYAKKEAEYVALISHGALYSDTMATESAYKNRAGNSDIIHLAMHTLINNHNPNLSKMIFSILKDTLEIIGLNVSEIYSIPLKAKMVVLSSCNTGTGNLRKGEGILSLARGFIYAGSKSVVMSLWEVNDESGTDIVKYFYKNIMNGDSKSESLRKARIKYLKSADQLRSHPYFWSTLVIYGDDAPLYISVKVKIISAILLVILLGSAIYYFKKR
jgi:CHAT domain-containing protein